MIKKLILAMIVFAAGSGAALQAQDIAGTWQGTLKPPGNGPGLRIVMKIEKAADQETLKAVMYSIDQGGQPINAGAITFQSSTLKIAVPAIGGNY